MARRNRADEEAMAQKIAASWDKAAIESLRERLARGLVQRGILSEERLKTLGVLARTRFPEVDHAPERELRERLQAVLIADRDPTEQETLLVGLLEPLGLIDSIVTKHQRGAAHKRAKTIAEHGLAGTAVRDSMRDIQAAVITAVVIPTFFASP